MNKLNVGFSKANVNPPLGIGVSGYYIPRFAKGFLDDLEVRTLAFSSADKKILMISLPVCLISKEKCLEYAGIIEEKTGVPKENIFISATHTHNGGLLEVTDAFEADETLINSYSELMGSRVVDSAVMALSDLAPAKMGYITGYAPERVAYIRRYKMKDGSTLTCPPINDPNIDYPIGELDQRVHILRFDRENKKSVVLVNYGLHADTINGEMLSSDWPHWMYKTIDAALDGVESIFFNGAEGDVGSTHVFPEGGDMNDTEISFDNEMKSPGMARFVGRAIAGTVLQVYDKVHYIDVDSIDIIRKTVSVSANVPSPEDLPLAKKYKELHESGRDNEIPYTAMQLTTVVAEALRMCNMENSPKEIQLDITGVRIGDVAFVGIPGEPFTEIGVEIKKADGYKMIMPCGLTNDYAGYFPVKEAFDEGGYEARTSKYKGDVAEKIIEGGKAVLKELLKG
ncbi:MAG: hypothetical protein E7406_00745 [Ruminococcaceae bacterium]|nr:hypothetical protein [Oscillospiraceae bacterium]